MGGDATFDVLHARSYPCRRETLRDPAQSPRRTAVIPIDIPRPLGSVAQRIVRPPSKHLIEQPTLPETWRAEPKP
jgi:hypothetical protein